MKKRTAPLRLFFSLFFRITPFAIAVFLAIGYVVISKTTASVSKRVEFQHAAQHYHARLMIIEKLETLKNFIRGLTVNDLVINGLIDVQNRSQYLPIFFQSLRMPGLGKANISLVDYKGRIVVSNYIATASYAASPFLPVTLKGEEYFEITTEKLLFARPIFYQGMAEGAVVVDYSKDQYDAILKVDVGTDAIIIADKGGKEMFNHPFSLKGFSQTFFWHTTPLKGYGNISISTGMEKSRALAPVHSLKKFLILSICLNIAALLGSLILTTHIITRPVINLTREMKKITELGALDRRVKEIGPKELREISKTFNRLISQLQKTMISRGGLREKVKERTQEIESMHSQMMMQEKMASVGQLAAGIAHELNNPINFVRTNFAALMDNFNDLSDILNDYRKLTLADFASRLPEVKEKEKALSLDYILGDLPTLFKESETGFSRITRIIQSMRDFSYVDQSGKLTYFNINKGIEDTLVIARNVYKYHAEIKKDLGELPEILCLPEQLNQVFLNLIVNSAQAMDNENSRKKGIIRIRTWADETTVGCEIADNGPGIPEAILSRIFEPFYTTKAPGKGTGLGLSISYDIIVLKHNGELFVECPEGGGTVFTLKVPRENKVEV